MVIFLKWRVIDFFFLVGCREKKSEGKNAIVARAHIFVFLLFKIVPFSLFPSLFTIALIHSLTQSSTALQRRSPKERKGGKEERTD